jgi:heme/copper-type cytochrome/quinol oxidase subunit 4
MKIVNIILGVATTLIIASLISLGIKAFYPEPKYPEYTSVVKSYPAPIEFTNCEKTDKECIAKRDTYDAEQKKQQEEFDKQQKAYNDATKVYNRDYFVISNVIGIFVFVIAFWLLMSASAASYAPLIGVMAAGLWSIFFGYIRGWESVDDKLKFVVGLVVAALVIGGSTWLLNRHYKKDLA